MQSWRYRLWLLFGSLFLGVTSALPIDKLSAQAYTEIGSLVNGQFGQIDAENQYMNRFGTFIDAADTVQNRMYIDVNLGGIFWQPLGLKEFWQKPLKFEPLIKQASAKMLFTPGLNLEMGYFPLKYNSPAMNLGEYLLRGESYPGYLVTGGWTWVDSAYAQVLGMRLQADNFGGKFRQQAGVFLEFTDAPFFDITPAYLFPGI